MFKIYPFVAFIFINYSGLFAFPQSHNSVASAFSAYVECSHVHNFTMEEKQTEDDLRTKSKQTEGL